MAIVQQSITPRFVLQFDDQIGVAQGLAQTLSRTIEQDLFRLRRYLPFDQGVSPDFFERHLTTVIIMGSGSAAALGVSDPTTLPGAGGAKNFKHSFFGTLWINAFGATGQPLTPDFARFLFIAEMSEQLMSNYGWVPNDSRGEALSRVLAEEFFPNAGYQAECVSLAPWVNPWLNSSPRFDYVNQNPAATASNKLLGGDLDGLGYGCGIVFINYLRYQLGFSLETICTGGGTTFADTYRNLTGRTDDPLKAMTTLLDAHFGAAFYNLPNNNPFPLLDASARKVTLGFASAVKNVPAFGRPSGGVAHLAPFFTCPAKDYAYHRELREVTWTVTATAIGFALPQFSWSLNGAALFSSSGSRDETVAYTVPDPNHPRTPKNASGTAHFRWSYADQVTRDDGLENVLVITNESVDGVYPMDLSVSVAETLGSDAATTAKFSLTFQAQLIRYEASYYSDGAKCAAQFAEEIPRLEKTIDLVLVAPDPPEWPGWTQAIEAVDAIRAEVRRIGEADPRRGREALEYAAGRLGVEVGVLVGKVEEPR